MGLTARDMVDMSRLAQLAASSQNGVSREEVYLAVAALYRVQGDALNDRERELMREILLRLAPSVETSIRAAFAERLADEVTVPHGLIEILVNDVVDVSRPVIARSPILTDADLLHLISEHGASHRAAIAQRPNIGKSVSESLIACGSEPVLCALVANANAKISDHGYRTLTEVSRLVKSIQEPLLKRADFPPALALRMREWVSDDVKAYIERNFAIASTEATPTVLSGNSVAPHSHRPEPTSEENSVKLVEKLAASGQLKAGFLMRALHQGQTELFDFALAHMFGLPLQRTRNIFYGGGPRAVALACRAVGIDRSVFATVYGLSRMARRMPKALNNVELSDVEATFRQFSKQEAMKEIRNFNLG